jgi:hypothetical protein
MATIEIQEIMLMALVVFLALKYRQAKRKFRMWGFKKSKVKGQKANSGTFSKGRAMNCESFNGKERTLIELFQKPIQLLLFAFVECCFGGLCLFKNQAPHH